MCGGPEGTNPRISDEVCGCEERTVWAVWTSTALNPIVLFGDTFNGKKDTGAPKKILEMEWTGGDSTDLVEVVMKNGF